MPSIRCEQPRPALLQAGTRTRSIAPTEQLEHVDVVNRRRTPWVDDDLGGEIARTFRLRPKRHHNVPPTIVGAYRVRIGMGPDCRWLGNETRTIGAVLANPDKQLRVLACHEPIELFRDG